MTGQRARHPGTAIEGAPIGSLLLQVQRAHARLATDLLNRAGITPPHEIVLLYLAEHGPVPQTELVHYMGRDRSTVTNTLQAMERAGLVLRTASTGDRRAMIVDLTDQGEQAAPAARVAWQELETVTVSGLSAAQRTALAEALSIVRDQLNRTIDMPAPVRTAQQPASSGRPQVRARRRQRGLWIDQRHPR
jgi:DNA-binding MarR family transcriptional regulator